MSNQEQEMKCPKCKALTLKSLNHRGDYRCQNEECGITLRSDTTQRMYDFNYFCTYCKTPVGHLISDGDYVYHDCPPFSSCCEKAKSLRFGEDYVYLSGGIKLKPKFMDENGGEVLPELWFADAGMEAIYKQLSALTDAVILLANNFVKSKE